MWLEFHIFEATALRAALNFCPFLLQLMEPKHLEKNTLQFHTW